MRCGHQSWQPKNFAVIGTCYNHPITPHHFSVFVRRTCDWLTRGQLESKTGLCISRFSLVLHFVCKTQSVLQLLLLTVALHTESALIFKSTYVFALPWRCFLHYQQCKAVGDRLQQRYWLARRSPGVALTQSRCVRHNFIPLQLTRKSEAWVLFRVSRVYFCS